MEVVEYNRAHEGREGMWYRMKCNEELYNLDGPDAMVQLRRMKKGIRGFDDVMPSVCLASRLLRRRFGVSNVRVFWGPLLRFCLVTVHTGWDDATVRMRLDSPRGLQLEVVQ